MKKILVYLNYVFNMFIDNPYEVVLTLGLLKLFIRFKIFSDAEIL